MADNFKPQSALAGNMSSTSFTLGQGNWARRWGRSQPVHGTASSAETILAEVEEGRFSQDNAGLAYGSDTLWVRCQFQDDSTVVGEGELASYWMGVPATLPAGYTIRNQRNIQPAVSSATGIGTNLTVNPFRITHSPTGFVRTADGLYTPLDSSNTYHWGPWNRDNLNVQESGVTYANDTVNKPLLTGHGAATSGTSSTLVGGYLVTTPGFRSVRVITQWDPNVYNGPPGYAQGASSNTITITMSTGASVTCTTNKADLSYDAGINKYIKDHGNIGDLLAPTGQVGTLSGTGSVTFSTTGSVFWGGGIANFLYLCPRVDIPLPYTATYGDLVAPGGIVTGSIPTY